MKKVWLINHYATAMFFDKAGRHYWFARQLKERGFDVRVFCSTTFLNREEKVDTGGRLYKTKKSNGIPFTFVKTTEEKGNGVKRVISWATFSFNLLRVSKAIIKKEGKPDLIIPSSVHPLTLVAGIKIAKKYKIPCICEVRDLWPEALFTLEVVKENSLAGRILSKGEHWIYKNADSLVFTKEGDTDHLKEEKWTTTQGGDIDLNKCYYINNGIDLLDYEKRIDINKFDDEDIKDQSTFKVIYAGTIRPTNNVGRIVDAAKIIQEKKEYSNIKFLIFGAGLELESLKARVNAERIDNVVFKGNVDRKYIPYILSRSSVNLLNYSQEKYNWSRGNSSNKLFEYMASGKPVISTVRMGYSIVNKYNCGVELTEDTSEKLAEEVLRFYNMSGEERNQIGENAKLGARDFDFKVLTDKLIDVINNVLENR